MRNDDLISVWRSSFDWIIRVIRAAVLPKTAASSRARPTWSYSGSGRTTMRYEDHSLHRSRARPAQCPDRPCRLVDKDCRGCRLAPEYRETPALDGGARRRSSDRKISRRSRSAWQLIPAWVQELEELGSK